MSKKEDVEFLHSKGIDLNFEFGQRCDVTHKKTDYSISVNGMRLSGEGLNKIIEFIDSNKENMSFKALSEISKTNELCNFCEESLSCFNLDNLLSMSRLEESSMVMCEDCVSTCKEIWYDGSDCIRYEDEKIKIIIRERKGSIYDIIENREVKSNSYIIIGKNGCVDTNIKVRFSNTERFLKALKNPEASKMSQMHTLVSATCDKCEERFRRNSEGIKVGMFSICGKCKKSLRKDIEDYIKNNEKIFMSNVI